MTHKHTQLLNNIDQLTTGDIILFRSVYYKTLAQNLIGVYQSLTSYNHGHYETVHAGICVGHDKNGPIIAHVNGGKHFSYVKQPLIDSNIEDHESRPLLVYRHHDDEIRDLIATQANNISQSKKVPKWTFSSAFKLIFPGTGKLHTPDEISLSTFCSKFVIEVVQQVTKNTTSYLNMNPVSSPKALEAELYNNPHYDLLIYTGNPIAQSRQGIDPYQALKNTISDELNRLSQQLNNKSVAAKYQQVKAALFRSENFAQHQTDSLLNAKNLLNEVMPTLQVNTGFNLRTPTSFNNVATQARKLGIFKWQAPVNTKKALCSDLTGDDNYVRNKMLSR